MNKPEQIFINYLKGKGLKYTPQRKIILDIFLKIEKHITIDELYRILRGRHKDIGSSTVFRTMKHFTDSGIAREVNFADGISRFEHKVGHEHHDHLICLKCGCNIEILDQAIETLQDKIAERHGFKLINHRLDLFGYCRKCSKI